MARFGWLGCGACALFVTGCGGGGGGAGTSGPGTSLNPVQTGYAVITVNWPASRGAGTYNSVRAIVSDRGKEVTSGLTSRPAQGTISTLTLSNLPAGTLTLAETGYANADGTGTAQTLGSSPLTIAAGGTTHVSLGDTQGTYYVSPQGSDTNTGTPALPWRTIQRAADAVRPGDTVVIADGEYAGGIRIRRGGTATAPVTFRASNPGSPTIRGDQTTSNDALLVTMADWVIIDGVTVTHGGHGIRVDQSNHVTVRRCRCLQNRVQGILTDYSDDLLIEYNECSGTVEQHGIYVSNGGDRPIVRNNLCRDNGHAGIQLNGDGKTVRTDLGARGDGIIEGAVVADNVISNCGLDPNNRASAINLACVRGSLIAGNLIYNCYGTGIALFNDNLPGATQWGCKNNQVQQNTVVFRPGEGRWCVSLKNGSTGNGVFNNLLVGGLRGALEFDNASSFTSDGNLLFSLSGADIATNEDGAAHYTLAEWRALGGNDMHSVTADPGFANASSPSDFLLRSGSPALGIGVAISDPVVDSNGRAFGANGRWDAGCYAGG